MPCSIQLHTVVFAWLHWISLLYYCGDISYQTIFLFVVNHSLQIFLSYSHNFWFFHPPCFEGFPRVYLVSHGWLIYMDDLWSWFMWLIYLWDSYVYKLIDKIFKVQPSLIFLKHQHGIRTYGMKEINFVQQAKPT